MREDKMGEWKPGALLVGPNDERFVVGFPSTPAFGEWVCIREPDVRVWLREEGPWRVVDEWPDPKQEARERLLDEIRVAWGGGRSSVGVLDALLARPDDLRLLLGDT